MKKHVWTLKDQTLSRHFERTNLLQAINLLGGMITVVCVPMLAYPFMDPEASDRTWTATAALVLGLIVGMALLATRHGALLEGPARRWTTWWGVLVPGYRQERKLDRASAVEITLQTEVVRSGHGGPNHVLEYYDVTIRLGDGPLRVDRFLDDPEEARWTAESVSRILRVRYRDRTATPVVEKSPDQLDESLSQRYRRTRAKPPEPRRPELCRALYTDLVEGLEIHVPQARLTDRWHTAFLSLTAAALVPLLLVLVKGVAWQVAVPLGLLGMFLTTARPLYRSWQAYRLTETVRLTPKSLRVQSSLYGDREIPLDELEELVLRDLSDMARYRETQTEGHFRHGFLCARSDRMEARFGGALDARELEYARDLLLQKIAAWAQS